MSKTRVAIGLGFGLLCSMAAVAADPYRGRSAYDYEFGPYLGVSVGEVLYNESGLDQMAPTVLMARLGQQFSPYFAVEGRVGTSVNGGYADGYHINAQAVYAGYVKGLLPLSPWFSAYAIAGLGGAQWRRNYPVHDSNDIGLSFGFGGEFFLGGPASLNVEWARLVTGTNDGYDYSAGQLTFGVNWRF